MLDLQKLDQELVLARVWELELVKGLAWVRELERRDTDVPSKPPRLIPLCFEGIHTEWFLCDFFDA